MTRIWERACELYAEERQRVIVESARVDGRVEVGSLASELGVTPETVRRDLTRLERRGMLRRTHGGAVPVDNFLLEREVEERLGTMVEEKQRIAKAALAFVPERGTVMLDAGTTTGTLAAMLPSDRDLTVVTNSLPVASTLAANPGLTVFFAGGRIRNRTMAGVGETATSFVRDLTPDVVFSAANGVSLEKGLTTPDMAEANVKRAMISVARRTILLVDHTKFGEEHFVTFARPSDMDIIVTDRGLSREEAEIYENEGQEVLRV